MPTPTQRAACSACPHFTLTRGNLATSSGAIVWPEGPCAADSLMMATLPGSPSKFAEPTNAMCPEALVAGRPGRDSAGFVATLLSG